MAAPIGRLLDERQQAAGHEEDPQDLLGGIGDRRQRIR